MVELRMGSLAGWWSAVNCIDERDGAPCGSVAVSIGGVQPRVTRRSNTPVTVKMWNRWVSQACA
jgi:hypothetical protein